RRRRGLFNLSGSGCTRYASGSATASCGIEPHEPHFPRLRASTERDVVCRCVHGEGQGEIRFREPPSSPLGPFDEPQSPRPRPLAESERLELGGVTKAVEIDVGDRQGPKLVQLDERIGRASNGFGDAELPKKATREGGLPGPELAREIDHREL